MATMSSGEWGATASQYLPFSALSGYGELVAEAAWRPEERPVLGEDELGALAEALISLRRGDRVAVTLYERGEVSTLRDVVRQVDVDLRVLRLRGRAVPFDELVSVEEVD